MAKKTYDYLFRFLLIGDSEVGKTQILYRFSNDSFNNTFEYTIGIDFRIQTIELMGKTIKVQIWDTSGKEIFKPITIPFYRKVMGFMLVYDITQKKSFENIEKWIQNVKEHANEDIKIILVGNKCDLEDQRQVSTDSARKLAASYGIKFIEVSAKKDINIHEVFFTLAADILAGLNEVVPKPVSSSEDLKRSAKVPGKEKNSFRRRLTSFFRGKPHNPSIPDEITEDPYALNLYETALRDGSELDRSVRINIVGNFRQGKTSLVRRLLGKSIGDVESTDGIEVNHYRYHRSADGKLSLKKARKKDTSDVVDRLVSVALSADQTLSQEQTSSIKQSLIVFPTTEAVRNTSGNEKSTNCKDLQFQLDEKDNRKGNSSKRNFSTTDTEEECQRDSREKEKFDKNLKVVMFSEKEKAKFQNEVTKRKSQSLRQKTRPSFYIWDFGGQYIFYATHTLFHSTHAVYLLVFDLSMNLGEVVIDKDFPGEPSENTMEYFIQFWMNSIHSFVGSKNGSEPKVILVGTHKDKIKGTAEDKRKYIENYFSRIRSSFDGTAIINHFHKEDFAVDNTVANDKATRELLETVISIGNDQSRMLSIPAKWIPLEKALIERKHIKVISFELVLAIDSANEIPLGDTEQVKLFLRYHHSQGTMIYFDEEPISMYVILDPQFLIDAFKSIITSERFCTCDPVIRPLWQMLLKEARLEQRLIDEQWKKDEDKMYMKHKEVLLAFLKKHHIISEATQFDEGTQQTVGLGWFVVPSLLKAQIPQSELCEFLTGKKQTVLRFVMMIDNSTIVPTVYHRLMAALIGKWPLIQYKKRTLISQNQCFVRLNIDHAGVAGMRQDSIELSVVNLCQSSNIESDQSDLFRRFSEEVIIHEFSKLHKKNEDRAKPYSRWYRCNHESHGVEGSNEIISADCFDERTSVPCPDLVSHDIQIKAKLEWTIDFRKKIIINNPKLSDKILGHVSQCIGMNWQLLGLELGISQVQIEQITEDNPNSVVLKIYKMLKAWCCQMEDSADMNVLVQAMQKCDNVKIEWDEIRNIIDEMK